MKKFTELLDNYLLTLGIHNQAHALYEHDPLKFGDEYRQSVEALKTAKNELNTYFDSIHTTLSDLTTP